MAFISVSSQPNTLLSASVGVRFTITFTKAMSAKAISAQYVWISSPIIKNLNASYKGMRQLIAVCPPNTTPHPIACFLKCLAYAAA